MHRRGTPPTAEARRAVEALDSPRIDGSEHLQLHFDAGRGHHTHGHTRTRRATRCVGRQEAAVAIERTAERARLSEQVVTSRSVGGRARVARLRERHARTGAVRPRYEHPPGRAHRARHVARSTQTAAVRQTHRATHARFERRRVARRAVKGRTLDNATRAPESDCTADAGCTADSDSTADSVCATHACRAAAPTSSVYLSRAATRRHPNGERDQQHRAPNHQPQSDLGHGIRLAKAALVPARSRHFPPVGELEWPTLAQRRIARSGDATRRAHRAACEVRCWIASARSPQPRKL